MHVCNNNNYNNNNYNNNNNNNNNNINNNGSSSSNNNLLSDIQCIIIRVQQTIILCACKNVRLLAYKKMNLINTRICSVMGWLVRFEIAPSLTLNLCVTVLLFIDTVDITVLLDL